MKKYNKRELTLLLEVLEAIANLKEKNGSTQKQIIQHIAYGLKKWENTRNVFVQVRRAIDHGLQLGLVKLQLGKYYLILDEKSYATYKKLDLIGKCHTCESRQDRRRREKRKRRERSTRFWQKLAREQQSRGLECKRGSCEHKDNKSPGYDSSDQGNSGQRKTKGTLEPKERGRRCGRCGRRQSTKVSPEQGSLEQEKKDQEETGNNNNKSEPKQNGNDQNLNKTCGNPDCLCALLQYR